MSRVEDYAEDVRRNFLAGLPHSSPAEAVAAGSRTLVEWCQALDRAREDAGIGSEKLPRGVQPVDVDGLVLEEAA